jgi:catechol 2,3-dioxygenase-like lactoylglutathione lyase family enzyme
VIISAARPAITLDSRHDPLDRPGWRRAAEQGIEPAPGGSTVRIKRVSFLGVRTNEFVAMTAFVRDVLGLQPGHRDDGWAVFQMGSEDRDLVEVYRPGGYDERLLPALATGPTVAFAVDDLLAARTELECAGIEIVADIVWAAEAFDDPRLDGWGWLFFRAPDGNIYALQQDHAPSDTTRRGGT